ncbi:hypothetical protein GTV32_15130 [Gordonia sp. SID5947]|uniref:WXG100-like domain-containing protein n=1 Tax=Gordonia sp. SID5947 TaxID=2690315 RepID=UPI00136B8552|nr:hypothetical protein [Gordonia sp. SID5947]MYR07553.1 hypothetical protein [Gordonia sp. SID5947]
MGMELPGALTGTLGLIGMDWPEGDETALDRMNDHWTTFGSDVGDLADDLTVLAGGILASIEGPTHDALTQHLQQFFAGEKSLDQLQSDAAYLADCCNNTSNEILTLKIFYIVELVALAAFIAIAIASAWINWGAPAEIAAAEIATQLTLRAAIQRAVQQIIAKLAELTIKDIGAAVMRSIGANTLKDVAIQLGIKAGVGALSGSGMEFGKQLALNVFADKDFDWGRVGLTGLQGAGAGLLLAPAAMPINNMFAKKFGAQYFGNKMRWLPVVNPNQAPGALDIVSAGTAVARGTASAPTTAAFKALVATSAVTALPTAAVKKLPGLDGATPTGEVGREVWQGIEDNSASDEAPAGDPGPQLATPPTSSATPSPEPNTPATPTSAAAPGSVPAPPPSAPAPSTP